MNQQPKVLTKLPMIGLLPPDLKQLVIDSFVPERFDFGDEIVREGAVSDGFYVLAEGCARLLKRGASGEEIALDIFRPGETFGAGGELDFSRRQSTVRASSEVTAYKLDATLFRALLRNHSEIKEHFERAREFRERRDFLRLYTVFSRLPAEALRLLDTEFEEVDVPGGDTVIVQGESPQAMFIIAEGKARAFVEQDNRRLDVAFLRKGEAFGLESVRANDPQPATVVAVGPCRLLRIPVRTFGKLYARFAEFREEIDKLLARQSYREVARLPLDFAEEMPSQDKDRSEPVGSVAVDHQDSAFRHGPFASPEGRFTKSAKRIRRVPLVRQVDEMDCGAASLSMVCRHFGKKVSLARIRQVVNTGNDGTSLRGLCRGAEAVGLAARSVKASKANVGEMPLPAIIHWENYHWLVLYHLDERHAWIADPARGLRKILRAELDEKWNGYAALFDYTEAFEFAPESKPGIKWLVPFFRPFTRIFAQAFGLAAVVSALQMLLPVFTQVIVDRVLVENDFGLLTMLMTALLVVLVIMTIAMVVQRFLLSFVAVRLDAATLDFITRKLLALPIAYFSSRKTGDIQRRILGVWQVREFFVQKGVNGLTSIAQLAAAITLMVAYSPKLALVFLAVAPLYAGLMSFSSKRLRPMFEDLEEAYGKYHSHQIDAIKGIETVKALGAEPALREKMLDEFHALAQKQFKSSFMMMTYDGAIQMVSFLAIALFLFIGAQEVMKGTMTIGAMVAFNSLVAMANAPILTLLSLWDNLQMSAVLLNRLNDIFESEPEQGADHSRLKPVRSLQGRVTLRNLSFGYHGSDGAKILDNVSLEVPAGKTVAIVGRSGSGKTTLAKCLTGLLEPTGGAVLFDGVELTKLDHRSLRQKVGFVLQENYLFDDTIANNIALGGDVVDPERVTWAAQVASADEFIDRLPLGYETRVGESGIALSGGQRQRIAIARAVYHRPPVLIFDEATSSLDSESERAVQENLEELLHGRTSFVIAHRLSTIRAADLIVVLERGRIVEMGGHEELMRRQGLYYHLSGQQLG